MIGFLNTELPLIQVVAVPTQKRPADLDLDNDDEEEETDERPNVRPE